MTPCVIRSLSWYGRVVLFLSLWSAANADENVAAPAPPGDCGPRLIRELSDDELVALFHAQGHWIEPLPDEDAEHAFFVRIGKQPYVIHNHQDRIDVTFILTPIITAARMNRWNARLNCSLVYRGPRGNEVFASVLLFRGGITPEYFWQFLRNMENTLRAYL